MKRGFGMITAFLVLTVSLCIGGIVMGRDRNDYARENERYMLLEDAFRERARRILDEQGFQNSGMTITWIREAGGVRSYRVEIHHSRIESLEKEEKERLTESLCWADFCKEVECFTIIYT